jgi:hypothetical protein
MSHATPKAVGMSLKQKLDQLGVPESLIIALLEHPARAEAVELIRAVLASIQGAEEAQVLRLFQSNIPLNVESMAFKQGSISLANRMTLVFRDILDIFNPDAPESNRPEGDAQ